MRSYLYYCRLDARSEARGKAGSKEDGGDGDAIPGRTMLCEALYKRMKKSWCVQMFRKLLKLLRS